jgi:hypothetical protein
MFWWICASMLETCKLWGFICKANNPAVGYAANLRMSCCLLLLAAAAAACVASAGPAR